VVDKVRDLQASKFADSGFGSPIFEATVVSNGGKRVEKIQIAKSGDEYIAKRENEPALYVIDATAVTDLQKAAADLKPEKQVSGKPKGPVIESHLVRSSALKISTRCPNSSELPTQRPDPERSRKEAPGG
jgi:hypothetical protein